MAPTLCSRCGDAVDEGCDPMDELAELRVDTMLKHLKLKLYVSTLRLLVLSPLTRPNSAIVYVFQFPVLWEPG